MRNKLSLFRATQQLGTLKNDVKVYEKKLNSQYCALAQKPFSTEQFYNFERTRQRLVELENIKRNLGELENQLSSPFPKK